MSSNQKIDPFDLHRQIPSLRAAEFLGLSLRKMEKMRQEGNGPKYVQAGYKTVRYRLKDLLEYQEQHLVENTIQGREILNEG